MDFQLAIHLSLIGQHLSAGVPTSPTFHHIEHDPPPSMYTPTPTAINPNSTSTAAILKLSLDLINTLKTILKNDLELDINHSRFEILVAHMWRCLCKARGLSGDQASKLHIASNGRSRLNPPVPSAYIGNVIFPTASVALSGNIQSEPLRYMVERIHNTIKRTDNEYLKLINHKHNLIDSLPLINL